MSKSIIRGGGVTSRSANRPNAARLDRLIEEATVDAYNESEQAVGLFTMMEEHLAVPFTTTVFGVEVTVERIDVTGADTILRSVVAAVPGCGCRFGIFRFRVRHQGEPSGLTPTGDGSRAVEVSRCLLPAADGIDGIQG